MALDLNWAFSKLKPGISRSRLTVAVELSCAGGRNGQDPEEPASFFRQICRKLSYN
jgi:hypothetical protein